jgi:hypothetical protein
MTPESPIVIATAPTSREADILRGLLQTEGIDTYEKGGAGFGVYGVTANVQIVVAPSDVDRAKEILEAEGVDLAGEYAPSQRLVTELNNFWPRGNRAIRILVWAWLGLFVFGIVFAVLASNLY